MNWTNLRALRTATLVRRTCLSTLFLSGILQGLSKMASASEHNFYQTKPAPIGIEVFGIDLKKDTPQEIIDHIKSDVHKHRVMIFRDQGEITGKRHVEISGWFGKLESTFYKHHKSPHPDVFRVSNDEDEGCRGVGRTGWHIDGSFQPAPFPYSLYHMAHVPQEGDTGASTYSLDLPYSH